MVLFFKHNPFVRLFFFLLIGFYLSSVFDIERNLFFLVGVCCLVLYLLYVICFSYSKIFLRYSERWVIGVVMGGMLICIGFCWPKLTIPVLFSDSFEGCFEGTIVELVGENSRNLRLKINTHCLESEDSLLVDELCGMFYVPIQSIQCKDSLVGCKIRGRGVLMPFEDVAVPHQFNYGKYLYRQGYSFSFIVKQIDLLERPASSSLSLWIEGIRNRFVSMFDRSIDQGEVSGIVKSLVLGDRTELDDKLEKQYVIAGAIHVLAVSGMHVGILFMMLDFVFSFVFIGKIKQVKFIAILIFLFGYSWLTRFSPSVTRSTIMFSILLIGREFSRQHSLYNSLAASGFIILLIMPGSFYHAGFWLSHLAVLGIGLFYNPIYKIFSFRFVGLQWFWSMISVSFAAQLMTFPISLFVFHSFPVYFLISNVLIIPIVPFVLIGSIVMLLFPVDGFINQVLAGGVKSGITFMNDSVEWISMLPHSSLNGLSLTGVEMLCLFIVLLGIAVFLSSRRFIVLLVTLSVFLIVLISVNVRRSLCVGNENVYCYSKGKKSMVNIISGYSNILIVDNMSKAKDFEFVFGGLWAYKMVEPPVLINIDDIVAKNGSCMFSFNKVDLLLVRKIDSGKNYCSENVIFWLKQSNEGDFNIKNLDAENVVLINSGKKLSKQISERSVNVYDLNELGYFSNTH